MKERQMRILFPQNNKKLQTNSCMSRQNIPINEMKSYGIEKVEDFKQKVVIS